MQTIDNRTALENMQYKVCTPQDIAFLYTHVAGCGPGRPRLTLKKYNYNFIITIWNIQKD